MTDVRTTNGRGRLFDSILETIGDTPCIKVNNLAPDHVTIYVKAEAFNPAASVKDRLAVSGQLSLDELPHVRGHLLAGRRQITLAHNRQNFPLLIRQNVLREFREGPGINIGGVGGALFSAGEPSPDANLAHMCGEHS